VLTSTSFLKDTLSSGRNNKSLSQTRSSPQKSVSKSFEVNHVSHVGLSRVKSLSFSILDLRLLGSLQTSSDLKQSQLVFYVSVLNSDFFTRKNLQNARDIVLPMESLADSDFLEIIVHSNKKKLGKLCVPLSDLVFAEPKWFTFDVCLDSAD